MYGLTAGVEPSSNFAIGFIQLIENKYRDLKPTVHTPNHHESIHFPSNPASNTTGPFLLSPLYFFILLPQNKGQSRQAKKLLKSTVGKSDPCWMNEDKPAGHWPREKREDKCFSSSASARGEKKCFLNIISVFFLNIIFVSFIGLKTNSKNVFSFQVSRNKLCCMFATSIAR